jgi:alkanesulfonate monooxygenase SsuD/methylene tetrahydromethanopterin reductase-like flavin-dependent oxidoreductase (luciferase family)
MKTDLLLIPMGATYPQMRAAAVAAEGAGFEGIWTWDHLRPDTAGTPNGVPECWTVLSALAEAVPRAMLGPLVLNVANRHPGLLANMAATLQQVSGGRLLLGIGAGGSRFTPYVEEQRALGRPVPGDAVRAEQVAEAIQVIRRLWAGDSTNFSGKHFSLTRPSGFLRPDPAPPIIAGGFGPKMAAVAGRWADGFNTQAGHPQLPALISIARQTHEAAGRDPSAFLITVFAGLSERWLRPGSRDRARLEELGVARLVLLASPPFDVDEIESAGALLGGG